jgi:hypothetical protein
MTTPYAKYPHATLKSIGTKLTGVHSTLSEGDKGAKDVGGLTDDQSDINHHIGDFRGEWDASVKKLQENIGTFGTLSTNIGTMVEGFDADVAKAIKPGDGGGSGHQPGPQAT